MATITVRNVPDEDYERLKRDAKPNHRSLEAEARARLGRAGPARPNGGWADELRRTIIDPGPDYEGSVALIRSIRDEE